MLIHSLIALALLAALASPALAQPAVPAVPPAAGARPAPVAAAPAPVAPRPGPAADATRTSDAAPMASAPIPVTPAFAPAPAARQAAATPNATVPAVAGDAPPTSDAPTTVARNAPVTAPSTGAAAPTTDAAAIPAVPTPESLQTVTKNYPVTAEGNAHFLATYATMSGVKTLDGGVMYRALVTGKGTTSPLGRLDTVTVSYRGWLIDGTSFDNSPIGAPRSFQLAQLIEGWRTALLKMKTGDLWEIVVPSPLAYGAEGRPGRIPPNQALIFVISLGKVEYAG